ncbi:dienelactone hydrolase family protein [Massilia sp. TWR1-2-2]|uniref:dienelactone hydrolase family protein n=1 Tax=Massilia sp. TWR1-2-2 TaxID=2804584 RepID=UPI003CEC9111
MARVLPSVRNITLAIIVGLASLPSFSVEQELKLDYRLNEHIVLIPAGSGRSMMETTVFQPNGPGPYPLLIINHGKEAGAPSAQQRDRFIFMATAFVKRGYAVIVPMRQGFANSTGRYKDFGCNMTANGYSQANDVRAAVNYARQQDWIDSDRIVVAGQSYGGMATMALGTEDLPGVRGLINFAGGLRDDANSCDWRGELVKAFGNYGAANKIASLWMYGSNDSLFGPELVRRMHGAFVRAGGQARLVEFGPFKRDAHGMIASRDGEKIWWQETEQFLKQVDMPTAVRYAVVPQPTLPKSDFANIDDVDAVPYMGEHGRTAYREYLSKMSPRAFAVSPNGAWCWAEEGEDPDARALATCEKKGGQPCKLYSVDEHVVWLADPSPLPDGTALASRVLPRAAGAVGGTSSVTN